MRAQTGQPRTQPAGEHGQQKKNKTNRAAAKTSALVAPRADAVADRTTTYRYVSPVSDPSELGSEPDSWLLSRTLRADE